MDARRAAWTVLRAVAVEDAYANLTLPKLLPEVPERDRAFAVELTYGALRAQGTLDHVLGLCASRPVEKIDPKLLDALRLGTYQLLRTRVPPHAAVSTTVALVRRCVGERAVGFANAVMRKVAAREGDLGLPDDPIDALAIETAHPRWIVEAFRDALGGDMEETRTALLTDDERPEVHLVARDVDRAELGGTPSPWSPYGVRLAGGDPGLVPAVRDGRAGVQDEGSQLAAIALARLAPDARYVADLCAGPGGKTALLRRLLPQASVVPAEIHPHRARLVERPVVVADARRPPWREGSFDAVLLDAPCSGLGALRRRPEARWRKQPEDIPGLVALQRELLDSALRSVRPGGIVLYVVCSPHPAETHGVTSGNVDVRAVLPGVPDLGGGPNVQLWPHRHGTDAMYLAASRRPSP